MAKFEYIQNSIRKCWYWSTCDDIYLKIAETKRDEMNLNTILYGTNTKSRALRYSLVYPITPRNTAPTSSLSLKRIVNTVYTVQRNDFTTHHALVAEQNQSFWLLSFREDFVDSHTSKEPIFETSSNLAYYKEFQCNFAACIGPNS